MRLKRTSHISWLTTMETTSARGSFKHAPACNVWPYFERFRALSLRSVATRRVRIRFRRCSTLSTFLKRKNSSANHWGVTLSNLHRTPRAHTLFRRWWAFLKSRRGSSYSMRCLRTWLNLQRTPMGFVSSKRSFRYTLLLTHYHQMPIGWRCLNSLKSFFRKSIKMWLNWFKIHSAITLSLKSSW